jgi:ribonucleotide monophosphatase NagD (HAD superfamily)
MGRLAGMTTALVLTGDNTLADCDAVAEAQRPDFVLHTLDQLIPEWAWAEASAG